MIVMKFGGSSLASAGAIRQAASIVAERLDLKPVVVVSAMGKTTDRLLEAAQSAAHGNSYAAWRQIESLRQMHFREVRELLGQRAEPFLHDSIAPIFRELQVLLVEVAEGREFTPEIQDQTLSYGERLSSLIVAETFRNLGIHAAQVDARKIIVTDEQFTRATPLYWDTYARLRRTVALVAQDRVVVMGGFMGATAGGVTTTLGRGGSDLTASVVGAGLSADEVQIWTDVDGMLSCDPRLLPGGKRLREITYEEAQEMARLGAKVLCAGSIAPAIPQHIPVVIRNSRRPAVEGTRIVSKVESVSGIVKCVTCKTGMAVVHLRVRRSGMLSSITDGLADLFARAHVSIDLIQTQERGISFAVQNWPGLSGLLRKVDETVEIAVEECRAAIWLVGQGVAHDPANLARAAAALNLTSVSLMSHGSSSLSLGFVVPESDLRAAVEALDREFFATPPSEVFAAGESTSSHSEQPDYHVSNPQPAARPQVAPAH
jgi:aspartate kinase